MHRGGAGPVGEQPQLLFLNSVLHLSAGAVDVLVDVAPSQLTRRQRCHHETGIGSLFQMLGFADHPTFSAPTVLSRVLEFLIETGGFARLLKFVVSLLQLLVDLPDQHRILARPIAYSTPLVSHQARMSSRQKLESPRSRILTLGHFSRICPTIRFSSSMMPALASILDGLNRAQRRNSPQKMYKGR